MARFKEFSGFLIFQAVKASLSALPRKLSLLLGRTLGLIFYYLDKRHRQTALSNLNIALGTELSGEFLMEIIKFPRLGEKKKEALVRIEGEEHLLDALKKEKGALIFSAHYGNWEFAPHFISKSGVVKVIARSLDNKLLEKELSKLRTLLGAKVIYKHQATKQILQSLREKEMVAFLIDQNVQRHQAVFVDFFGKKAATTPALAAFFLKTQSPLVPVFCYPTTSFTYHLKILSPLKIELEGEYNKDVLKITQICTKIIESLIRNNPAYWFWFHNRWKTKPDEKEEIKSESQ
jgi:KDO2-lipid IV(A) lauroyltransferase